MSTGSSKKMFVISSLDGGGAERVVCSMASYWADKGEDIVVATLAGKDSPISFPLSKAVTLRPLGVLGKSKNAVWDNMARLKKLRDVFEEEQPDVVLSFMENVNVLSIISSVGLSIPVIISDRIDPKSYGYGRIWRFLRNITYPFSSFLVVQTKAVLQRYPRFVSRNAVVVPNFVAPQPECGEDRGGSALICAMGRLSEQKGFDVLIRAFARLSVNFPDWSLEIWGEGEERRNLEKLIVELDISEKVQLPGFSQSPYNVMKRSDLFVLSSRYEGFPNVLMEAMACGLPVISTRCPFGPEEIVRDGENGILVPVDDVDALASALVALM